MAETSFGLAPSVGLSANYARADHTHGTPPLPFAAGDSVVAATSFGVSASPGSSADYARADHSHGLPPLPNLAGDATGSIVSNKVTGLQGRAVAATAPAIGQTLVWNGSNWAPAAPPAAAAPKVQIVAAGMIRGDGVVSGVQFGNLQVVSLATGFLTLSFNGYQVPDSSVNFIVKVTPVENAGTSLIANFDAFFSNGFRLVLTKGPGLFAPAAELLSTSFMVEISSISP